MATFSFAAYTDIFLGEVSLSDGDKMILPPSVLSSLATRFGSRPIPSPIIFEVRNPAIGKSTHCGVLEFTAPREEAFFPQWIMHELLLEDGARIRLTLRELPKATKATLQPLQAAFCRLDSTESVLLQGLRNFVALTEGDCIEITSNGKQYNLNVVALQPKSKTQAVCLIDTDMKVEFLPPVEPLAEDNTVIALNQTVAGSLPANGYAYYRVKLVDPNCPVLFQLSAKHGDPDLYISTTVQQPSHSACFWKAVGSGNDSVQVNVSDPHFSSSWYYIAVHAYKAPAIFELLVTEVTAPVMLPEVGTLKIGRTNTSERPEGSVRCGNCGNWIPGSRAAIHEGVCRRNNWKCPVCKVLMRASDKAIHVHCPECNESLSRADLPKHVDLNHSIYHCECGEGVPQNQVAFHKSDQCALRLKQCSYCNMQLPLSVLSPHQQQCGNNTELCSVCGKRYMRRKKAIHMAVEHNVNPSLPSPVPPEHSSLDTLPEDIGNPSLQRQESAYNRPTECAYCNKQFKGIEELLVHLTECPEFKHFGD